MDKRERFLNFLQNKPVDRVPVAIFHHFTTYDEWLEGLARPEVFEKNILGHKKSRDVFDPDVVKVMNDSLMIMEVDVSGVKTARDLAKIVPPAMDSAWMVKTKELTLRSLEYYKDSEAPKYVTGFSPFMVLRNSFSRCFRGRDYRTMLLNYLEEDPDAFLKGLDIIGDTIMALHEMLVKECGADGIYFSVNNQSHFFPDEIYTKYITPSDKKVIAHANTLSDINLLHICGYAGKANNLELFKDYDIAGFNWAVHAEGVTLSEGKKLFGGKAVFGGFEQATVIYTGTKEEVQEFTYRILDEAGQTGIMIGADCTVPTDIDDNRLEWVREACIKYAEGKRYFSVISHTQNKARKSLVFTCSIFLFGKIYYIGFSAGKLGLQGKVCATDKQR